MKVSLILEEDNHPPCVNCGQPSDGVETMMTGWKTCFCLCKRCTEDLAVQASACIASWNRRTASTSTLVRQCKHLGCRNLAIANGVCGAHPKG